MIALDAATRSITLVYDNSSINGVSREYYTISYDMEIPNDGYKILNSIVDVLENL